MKFVFLFLVLVSMTFASTAYTADSTYTEIASMYMPENGKVIYSGTNVFSYNGNFTGKSYISKELPNHLKTKWDQKWRVRVNAIYSDQSGNFVAVECFRPADNNQGPSDNTVIITYLLNGKDGTIVDSIADKQVFFVDDRGTVLICDGYVGPDGTIKQKVETGLITHNLITKRKRKIRFDYIPDEIYAGSVRLLLTAFDTTAVHRLHLFSGKLGKLDSLNEIATFAYVQPGAVQTSKIIDDSTILAGDSICRFDGAGISCTPTVNQSAQDMIPAGSHFVAQMGGFLYYQAIGRKEVRRIPNIHKRSDPSTTVPNFSTGYRIFELQDYFVIRTSDTSVDVVAKKAGGPR